MTQKGYLNLEQSKRGSIGSSTASRKPKPYKDSAKSQSLTQVADISHMAHNVILPAHHVSQDEKEIREMMLGNLKIQGNAEQK